MRNSGHIVLVGLLCILAACGRTERHEWEAVDSLNARAYRFRYADIDSVERLTREAMAAAKAYPEGQCEARLNMAFVAYQRMDFDGVDSILRTVYEGDGGRLTALCADVMQMKVCQRTGDGERFFRVKGDAEDRMQRLRGREGRMTAREQALWVYAQTEYHIITSTYYFYQEQDSVARAELAHVPECMKLRVDTAQWVYYNYMLGPGGLVEGRDAEDITLQEFDYLFKAYSLSRREGLIYFEANCLQAFATMVLHSDSLLRERRSDEYQLLCFQHDIPASTASQATPPHGGDGGGSLPLALAQRALGLFQQYDDLFQTACAYRTLGEVYFQLGDYDRSLASYAQALHCVNRHHLRYYGQLSPDTLSAFNPDDVQRSVEQEWTDDSRIKTVPEWIAGIRQQLSLTYSALGMKQASDYNRNFYLDLLQATNQNQELESRTLELERQTRALRSRMVLCLVLLSVALMMALLLRRRLKRRVAGTLRELEDNRWAAFREFAEWNRTTLASLEEEREEGEEQLLVSQRRMAEDKRKNAENRAKVSLVHSIVPFLDRIAGEVGRMDSFPAERRAYIVELVDEIERYNAILTEWIRMEQGQLSLHITTVRLQSLFDIVGEGHYAFDQKGVQLCVEPTDLLVKADESLTLFMVNTLCDNARKFTPRGGRVTLSAREGEGYVEVSVADTGCGLSPEDVETLMHQKVYDATQIGTTPTDGADTAASPSAEGKGFGFGLMNCRGIIEKYKKTSALFACCDFGVRSRVGEGSTFYFRLPRVVRTVLLMLVLPLCAYAQTGAVMTEAELYDSLYEANVEARYDDAVRHATQAIETLNAAHPGLPPMLLHDTVFQREPAEVLWARSGAKADYELIVGLRNELALAALALNDWSLYAYNNRACIRLHRFLHQDHELPTYFRRLERTHQRSNILLVFIVLVSVLILFIAVRLLVGLQLYKQRELDALKQYLLHLFRVARTCPHPDDFLRQTQALPDMRRQAEQMRQRVAGRSVEPIAHLQDEIATLTDERARLDFEQRRLYIQNQILDNCLSTIKHESMYYPSRIRLVAEKMQDTDVEQLSELVRYYRHLYALLCRQADEQVGQPAFKRARVEVRSEKRETRSEKRETRSEKRETRSEKREVRSEKLASPPSLSVWADPFLLDLLLESLRTGMGHDGCEPELSVGRDGDFVRFTLRDTETTLSPDQLAALFFPDARRIPLLVAKQILREHDTYLGHPGLRLAAQPAPDGGYEIYFTLPLADPPQPSLKGREKASPFKGEVGEGL